MGYHTFVSSEVLTAANVMTYLMKQANIVCTSATRPASPATGEIIFETDTLLLQMYTGAAWVPHGRQNGPVGLVAKSTGPAALQDNGATPTVTVTQTVNMVSGRSYRITGQVQAQQITLTGTPEARIWVGGAEPVPAGRCFGSVSYAAPSAAISGCAVVTYTAPSTAAVVCAVVTFSSAGAIRIQPNSCQITVEDVGV